MHEASTHPASTSDTRIERLQPSIDHAMPADRRRLEQQLRSIRRLAKAGKPYDRSLDRLERELAQSIHLRGYRRSHVPSVRFDVDLPILAKRDEIAAAIEAHSVVIVCGETGSGKSTQLPKICLSLGRGVDGVIGHTQPRRIAARSVAARVAEELAVPLGQDVGYKLRFQDRTSPETYVKLMTDGVLLAETQSDRWLWRYDTIIIDEAHERSLNIDFLLGYVKQLTAKRPDLRVIVTSATIDAERFAEYFGTPEEPAAVIEVSGRGYPVEVQYRPPETDDEEEDSARHVAATICEAVSHGPGDILVFLPTERDIRDIAKLLRSDAATRRAIGRAEVLPLYARLSIGDQDRVFRPSKSRRIVLATNVAESSLTVPGIRYVIDTGQARISRYAPRSKVQRLPVEPISRASADQRAGRCGRVGPGTCFRLYSEEDYAGREAYTAPEIRRMNLASVVLKTLALGQGDVDDFPFLDRPRPDAVKAGYKDLFELGAIDENRQLTDLGLRLSQLPLDPRIGRMILAAGENRCLADVLVIAAALEVQDPRERPPERQKEADAAHARWLHEDSDFIGLLRLWDFFHDLKSSLSRRQLRKACAEHFLSFPRIREWQDVHRQLLDLAKQHGMKVGPRSNKYGPIHKSLLTGLLSGIAVSRASQRDYLGAENQSFQLWPGAGPYRRKPKWIMAAELVETSQRYLRTVGRIEPEWIEPLAKHLVERTYHFPRWSRKEDTVLAQERVILFGLTVARRRNVRYGPIAPIAARELFIREGLVHGQMRASFRFLRRNLQLLTQISSAAARTRSRKLVVDEISLIAFYEERLPPDAYDVATLRRALRRDPGLARRLEMQWSDLVAESSLDHFRESYPDRLELSDQELRVDYRFEAGAKNDGVTITVPKEALVHLHEDQLGWLVPGLLEEKLVALIRTLPKELRRGLVPAPDAAREAASRLTFGQGRFLPTAAHALSEVAGEPISAELLRTELLPDHLHTNIRVVDEAGTCIAEGRDLRRLREDLYPSAPPTDEPLHDPAWHRDNIRSWDFGDLPERVEIRRGSFAWTAFPCLVDQGESVALRLMSSAAAARAATHRGVLRLFILARRTELVDHIDWLPDFDRLKKLAKPLRRHKPFKEQLIELVAARALAVMDALPRSAAEFDTLQARAGERIPVAVQEALSVVAPLLEAHAEVTEQLQRTRPVLRETSEADIAGQLAELLPEEFLVETPWEWLQHVPRYLRGIALRIEKIRSGHPDRDVHLAKELQPHLARLRDFTHRMGDEANNNAHLQKYRWMIEEYRVSLFAQELGTSLKVSSQRLDRQWAEIER